jgi:acyl-coenzyme A thioesterase PaaI-like protein
MTAEELQGLLGQGFPDAVVPAVDAVTPDGIVLRQAVSDRHGRPGGTVSGPTMMSLADTTAWLAILSRIGPVVLAVTTSLHIDFLRKPALEDLVATGVLLKLGARLAVVDVTLRTVGHESPVAKAQVTYSIPPRRSPATP